ncbi:MAG: SAM-dependent methyltransferase [Pseudomonadota bacterium]
MIDLWLIGIGTGNPGHVTLEARDALRQASLVLVPRKGPDKAALVDLRHTILRACDSPARVVEFDMPVRDESQRCGYESVRRESCRRRFSVVLLARRAMRISLAVRTSRKPSRRSSRSFLSSRFCATRTSLLA